MMIMASILASVMVLAAQAIPDEFRFLVLGISPLPECSTGGNRDDRFGTPCGCRLIHDISGNWMQQLLLDVTRGCGFYFGAVSLVSFKLVGDRNASFVTRNKTR